MQPVALAMYRNDPSPDVRASALVAYARLAGASAIQVLVEATQPGHTEDVRATAASALGRTQSASVNDALERLTDASESRGLRQAALMAVMAVGDAARTVAVASKALKDYDPLFARAAVQVLARVGTPAARAALQEARSSESRVHVKAAIDRALAGGS